MVGERIVTLRTKESLSQGALAQLVGVSRQAVSKWENNLATPDMAKLITLAEIFHVDVEYLATGKQPDAPEPPIVVNVVKKVDKIIERTVEKPVIKRVVQVKYRNNPYFCSFIAILFFLFGLCIGCFLL